MRIHNTTGMTQPVMRIRMFLGLPDPNLDPLVSGMDPAPDPAPDPSIIMEKL
jgi:hypothetical protein